MNSIPSNGDPRHAAIAILGKPLRAIDKFEMKSRRLVPQASIVRPMVGSLKLNATPIVYHSENI